MSLGNIFKQNNTSDVFSVIDTALVYSDKFRDADEGTIGVGPTTFDAFMFLRKLLEKVLGREELVKTLSQFISFQIPIIETAVKAVMLVKLNQFSKMCTLRNTFLIPDYLIRDGIRMSAKEVDTIGMLHRTPLDVRYTTTEKYKLDKYYYFGNDDFTVFDELRESPDLNTFLWYVLNVSEGREGWYGSIIHNERVDDPDRPGKTKTEKRYYNKPNREGNTNPIDLKRDEFICTLVSNDGQNYATADGILLHGSQRPNTSSEFSFYFGDAREIEYEERERYQKEQERLKKRVSRYYKEIDTLEVEIRNKFDNIRYIEDTFLKRDEEGNVLDITKQNNKELLKELTEKENEIKVLKEEIRETSETISTKRDNINALRQEITDNKNAYRQLRRNLTYPDYRKNKYFRKPIQKFNFDYLMNTKLLDERIVAVQIIEMLFNLKLNVTFHAHLTYQEIAIVNEVKKMVKSVLDTDEAIVSDCFFSFSNDEFNALLEETERQFNQQGYLNRNVSNDIVEEIFSNIDNIRPNSDKNVNQEIINNSMEAIMGSIGYGYDFEDKHKLDYDGDFDIGFKDLLNQLLEGLCNVIVTSVLTPKIIMLMVVNKRVNDGNIATDFIGWLKSSRGLIIAIIRKVKDMIIEYLVSILNRRLLEILDEVALLYAKEQIDYYTRLINRMLECVNSFGQDLNFRPDRVHTADIYDQGKPSKKNDC